MQGERLVGERLEQSRRTHGVDLILRSSLFGETGLGGLRSFTMLFPEPGDLLLGCLVAGVDFSGVEKLNQRALLVAAEEQLASLGEVQRRCRYPDPDQSGAVGQLFRRLGVGLLVIIEGGVVVFARLSNLAVLEKRGSRFSMQLRARQNKYGQ